MRPVLFHVFGIQQLPLYSYGLMLATSLIVGWYLTLTLCERDGMDKELMGRCYMWTAGSAVVGSRLLYVFTNLDHFDSFIDIFKVWQGGLVAYGGFIGGFLGSLVFCRIYGIRLLAWADCAVPSLCTGLMITRIGCLMYGCDFGKPFDGHWSIIFPAGSPAFNEQVHDGLIAATAPHSLPVHPTQLYESLNGLVLFSLLMLTRRFRKFSGEMFVVFTMGYAVLRYYVETLRADEGRGSIGPLSTSQAIGIATFSAGAVLLVWLYSRYRKDPHSMQLWLDHQAMPGAAVAVPAVSAPRVVVNANAERRKRKKARS